MVIGFAGGAFLLGRKAVACSVRSCAIATSVLLDRAFLGKVIPALTLEASGGFALGPFHVASFITD